MQSGALPDAAEVLQQRAVGLNEKDLLEWLRDRERRHRQHAYRPVDPCRDHVGRKGWRENRNPLRGLLRRCFPTSNCGKLPRRLLGSVQVGRSNSLGKA